MPVMVMSICEILENWGRQGRTVLTGVTEITRMSFLYFRTVHLRIILVDNQFDAQFLL